MQPRDDDDKAQHTDGTYLMNGHTPNNNITCDC